MTKNNTESHYFPVLTLCRPLWPSLPFPCLVLPSQRTCKAETPVSILQLREQFSAAPRHPEINTANLTLAWKHHHKWASEKPPGWVATFILLVFPPGVNGILANTLMPGTAELKGDQGDMGAGKGFFQSCKF